MKEKTPLGIILLGLCFTLSSFYQMYIKVLPGYYAWYTSLFHPTPDQQVLLRYMLSIIYRILELRAALGILWRREYGRRLILCLSWFTIGIVYWKHPFKALEQHSSAVINALQSAGVQGMSSMPLQAFTWLVLIGVYTFDISASLVTIYYFTRPSIKQYFK